MESFYYSTVIAKKGEKNILNGQDALEGDPYIVGFDSVEVNEYQNFMGDLVRYRMNQADGLEQAEKDESTSTILSKVNIQSHLENVFLYGQSKTSVYKPVNGGPAFPNALKKSLKPYQIYDAGAASDEKLKAYAISRGQTPGYIWIEPESDYEVKIIRVDPSTKIEYEEAKESYENFMKFSVDYMDRVPRLVGRKIDELEKKIRAQVPQAIFIDIEIN